MTEEIGERENREIRIDSKESMIDIVRIHHLYNSFYPLCSYLLNIELTML